MGMRCEEIQEMLPAFVGQGEETLAFRRHLARCKECRAEMKRYEELAAGLGSLARVPSEPPADLLPALVSIPERAGRAAVLRGHLARNRKAYAGGAAVAVAIAGATGAALWRNRSRRPLTA